MKLFAPKYYKDFHCIADKCRHSCCVGWEIDVDSCTMEIYSSLTEGYGIKIKESIDLTETPHFRLCENEKCPHLDDKGLCRIISEYGEDYLCDICREHPRFYNDTARGKEVGIGMSCEEAARIILSSDFYNDFCVVEELEGEVDIYDFDAVGYRARIYDILAENELKYHEKLHKISCEFDVSLSQKTDGEWRELLASLEYLDDAHKGLFACFSVNNNVLQKHEKQLERAFAYFVYRHCSGAYDLEELRASLGFALICERLLASLALENDVAITELARIISEEIEYSEDNTEIIKSQFCK